MVCIQLGSNKGDRRAALEIAKEELRGKIHIECEGAIYETEAWGNKNQKAFYNQLIIIKTDLNPFALLRFTQSIEFKMGRRRIEKWGPRIIDIDIICFESKVIFTPNLKIPHEFMSERRFVLQPLRALLPDWKHPLKNQTVESLLNNCKDNSEVKRIEFNVE